MNDFRLKLNVPHKLGIISTMENQKDEFKYYQLPKEVVRTTNHFEVEKPSGKLEINFYPPETPFPEEISCLEHENLWILIASGNGTITKSSQDFTIDNVPAVFFLQTAETIKTQGQFSAWIVRLKETTPTSNPPTGNTVISEKILTAKELKDLKEEAAKAHPSVAEKFPAGKGETICWALGQWNSQSPLNIAFEGGGLGSIGDEMHKEPQVVEIHLVNQGRCVLTCIDENNNPFKFPQQKKGDLVIIQPGTFCQMSRYSGDYKGFTIKWAVEPGGLIDPKAKIYHPLLNLF